MRSFLSRLASVAVVLGLALPALAIEPKLLPPNADVIVTVNLKQIFDSEVLKDKKDLVDQGKAFLKQKLAESPAKEFFDKAGFDVFRDLHSVTVCSDGSKDPDTGFIAIEGKFDPEKLIDAAKEAAAKNGEKLSVTKAGNVSIFEISPNANEKTIYAGLVNDSLLVGAMNRKVLDGAIARINGGKTTGMKAGFKELFETTTAKQCISIVASSQGLAKMAENAPKQPGGDVGAALQNLDGIGISINLTKDIVFQVTGAAKDEDNAKKLAMAANGGIVLARGMVIQQAKQDAKLQPVADIANTLRISTNGVNIVLRGEVTQANLNRILEMIPKQ